ncbi:MAG TPA: Wzz/FepE/Etk N-terminal domain-containing protein [bacterium]|nr:Wzz/FepE/Etk N-terminal domain-containing protein [bacterium]
MEEEIDLRELFLVLWRKKYFVGIITFGVTVISIIYAFSLPRIYETFATIMIIPSKLEFIRAPLDTTIDNNRSGAYKSLLTLDTHKNLLVSTTVLLKLLQNIGDAELTMDDIRSMLKVEEVKGTSLLTLKVRTDDKEKCKKIADFWVKIYLEESEKLVSEEGSTTMEFLYREYEANKQKLEEKERGYALFLEKSDLTVLNTQYGLLQAKLRDYQKSMVNKIDELKVSQQEIESLKGEIAKHSRYIALSKDVGYDTLGERFEGNQAASREATGKKLTAQTLNPIYQDMEKRIADKEVTVSSIIKETEYYESQYEKTRKELSVLEEELNRLNFRKTRLERDLELASNKFKTLFSRINDAELATRANIGDVKVISYSVTPDYAIAPKKRLIVGGSFAGSLIFSLVLSLILEFFKNIMALNRGK